MPEMDTVELFRKIAQSLEAEFAILHHIPHAGESGRATEDALRSFLRRHLPGRFELTSGFAIGANGETSNQSDVLVIDALNTPRFLHTDTSGVFPIDGILCDLEVTQNLDSEKRLEDACKIRTFRSLPSALTADFAPDFFPETGPLAFLVAEDSDTSIEAHAKWLGRLARDAASVEDRARLPNGILILKKGLALFQDEGGFHPWPSRAKGVIAVSDVPTSLLVWLSALLGALRILLEHRIRANTRRIFRIRQPKRKESFDWVPDAAGGDGPVACAGSNAAEGSGIGQRRVDWSFRRRDTHRCPLQCAMVSQSRVPQGARRAFRPFEQQLRTKLAARQRRGGPRRRSASYDRAIV